MLINHLPEYMGQVKEISRIMEAESGEIDLVRNALGKSLDNSFASYADESMSGLDRWERLFKIPYKAGRGVSERRREIIARLSDNLPYTYNALEHVLSSLYYSTNYYIERDYGNFTLRLFFIAELEVFFLEIDRLLRRWLPANMAIEIIFVFKRHREVGGCRHRQLGEQTHLQIKKEGIERRLR
ncbi:MAG: YmfQ family protein [Oscillospiraceae bacterium]|nr:YmfQ family protein [Oscillospiraceae bacterium]